MNKYYLMAVKTPDNGTVLRKKSHRFTRLKTGHLFTEEFKDPFEYQLLGNFQMDLCQLFI